SHRSTGTSIGYAGSTPSSWSRLARCVRTSSGPRPARTYHRSANGSGLSWPNWSITVKKKSTWSWIASRRTSGLEIEQGRRSIFGENLGVFHSLTPPHSGAFRTLQLRKRWLHRTSSFTRSTIGGICRTTRKPFGERRNAFGRNRNQAYFHGTIDNSLYRF